jgi:hypothetical protein
MVGHAMPPVCGARYGPRRLCPQLIPCLVGKPSFLPGPALACMFETLSCCDQGTSN